MLTIFAQRSEQEERGRRLLAVNRWLPAAFDYGNSVGLTDDEVADTVQVVSAATPNLTWGEIRIRLGVRAIELIPGTWRP